MYSLLSLRSFVSRNSRLSIARLFPTANKGNQPMLWVAPIFDGSVFIKQRSY